MQIKKDGWRYINIFNKMSQSASQKLQDKEICSICIDKRLNAHIVPCQHKFCSKCILRWSKKQSSCPICRQQFTEILTSRRRIEVKPIVNPVPRSSRRNVTPMNMIFVPMPIINYSWGMNPYMMQQSFFYTPPQLQNPYFLPHFGNVANPLSN